MLYVPIGMTEGMEDVEQEGRIGRMIEVRDGPFCTSRMDNSSIVREREAI